MLVENKNPQRAWMLNQIISNLNDEGGYYGSWLSIWPDGADRQDCEFYFSDDEDLIDLQDLFDIIYKRYHKNGLFTNDQELIDYAHQEDKRLGLNDIQIIYPTSESLTEDVATQFNYTDDDLSNALFKKVKEECPTTVTIQGPYQHDYWEDWWDEEDFPVEYKVIASTNVDGEITLDYSFSFADSVNEYREKFAKEDIEKVDLEDLDDLVDYLLLNINIPYEVDKAVEEYHGSVFDK